MSFERLLSALSAMLDSRDRKYGGGVVETVTLHIYTDGQHLANAFFHLQIDGSIRSD